MAPLRPALDVRTDAGPAPALTLDALRARGAQRLAPLRFAFAQALARRAAAHQGPVRELLDARLALALADCAAQCGQALAGAGPAGARPAAHGQPGPLGDLVRLLDGQPGAALAGAQDASTAAPQPGPPAELKSLQQSRSTWARLSVDRQLSRSLAQLPQNPGPLNSQLLALRSLQLMQDIAPAYLQGFVAQVETLLWLEDASQGAAPLPGKRRRPLAATGSGLPLARS